MKKTFILGLVCIALLISCKKEEIMELPDKTVRSTYLRFNPPETDEEIYELLNNFDSEYDAYKESTNNTPSWSEMEMVEIVWTLEASNNRYFTNNLDAADSLIYSSINYNIAVSSNNGEDFYADYTEVFRCHDSIRSFISDVLGSSSFDFWASDVEATTNDGGDSLKISLTVIQYNAFAGTVSDFQPGQSAQLHNKAAFDIQRKLNQYFLEGVLHNGFFTSITTLPNPTPAGWYMIIDHAHTICPGYSTLDYFGSSGLRWLWSNPNNITLIYSQLNMSYHGLRDYIEYRMNSAPSGWGVVGVSMDSEDHGYYIDTSIQQGVYGCYPLSYRYSHYMRFRMGRWTLQDPSTN